MVIRRRSAVGGGRPERKRGEKELRLALAMRGGVSLAVWIGGACAEIDSMRRARPAVDQKGSGGAHNETPPPGAAAASAFWGPLLKIAGYNAVRIDVLAGTSAGGLNSVLLATSVKYGVDFDAFRDLWLDVGDLRKLVRGTDEPNPQSLLKGDAHFLVTMRDVLERCLIGRAPNSSYVDLSLTGTILDALGKPSLDDLGAPVLEPSHRAAFRFRTNIGTTDFPAFASAGANTASSREQRPSQEAFNQGLAAKLALAARSTSSFPGAFEPAQVRVCRPGSDGQVGWRSPATDGAENLFGQFSDAARTNYHVIDGGVLDNIPVTRAIHAVAGAPAEVATRRYLLYLDPSPRVAGFADEAETPTPTDLVSTLSGASGAKGTAESVLDDIEELRRHNDVAERYRALQRMITAQLAAGPALYASPEMLQASNEQRATLEAGRIRAL